LRARIDADDLLFQVGVPPGFLIECAVERCLLKGDPVNAVGDPVADGQHEQQQDQPRRVLGRHVPPLVTRDP
jgi:hypothetical protein